MEEILEGGVIEAGPREPDWILAEAERRCGSAGRAEVAGAAEEMASRRAAGEPLQYVIGTQSFRHLEVEVGQGVFIPRPETEQVAERAISLLPQGGLLVDLGTGSGAVALAAITERPDAAVWATELSREALSYAVRNAAAVGADPDRFLEGDLFDPIPPDLRGEFDVVVANPPYVARAEADSLPVDVIEHEPEIALFAPDEGLGLIRRIAGEAQGWLAPGGSLVLEIGAKQADDVRAILRDAGYLRVSIEPDAAGSQRIAIGAPAARWDETARVLEDGGIAIVPTDTVFGIAAAVGRPRSIQGIFRLKGRPGSKALPVLVHHIEAAAELGVFDRTARLLAERFWPGALTLVVPRRAGNDLDLGGDDPTTIAIRIPNHRDLLRLLAWSGPLAVTSANRSGEQAAASATGARAAFPELEVMPGAPGGGEESTVVSVIGDPSVLRVGALSEDQILRVIRT